MMKTVCLNHTPGLFCLCALIPSHAQSVYTSSFEIIKFWSNKYGHVLFVFWWNNASNIMSKSLILTLKVIRRFKKRSYLCVLVWHLSASINSKYSLIYKRNTKLLSTSYLRWASSEDCFCVVCLSCILGSWRRWRCGTDVVVGVTSLMVMTSQALESRTTRTKHNEG